MGGGLTKRNRSFPDHGTSSAPQSSSVVSVAGTATLRKCFSPWTESGVALRLPTPSETLPRHQEPGRDGNIKETIDGGTLTLALSRPTREGKRRTPGLKSDAPSPRASAAPPIGWESP